VRSKATTPYSCAEAKESVRGLHCARLAVAAGSETCPTSPSPQNDSAEAKGLLGLPACKADYFRIGQNKKNVGISLDLFKQPVYNSANLMVIFTGFL
jgi:hypothetical protein